MRNFHNNYHLPKVMKGQHPQSNLDLQNEFEAQDSLFQISKIDDNHLLPQENFIQDFYKEKPEKKRSQISSMSLPKKKEMSELAPVVEVSTFRQTSAQNLNSTPVTITNYLIMDQARHKKRHSGELSPRRDKKLIQQQINRNAKYLFRLRNRNKLPSLSGGREDNFKNPFYCNNITPSIVQE